MKIPVDIETIKKDLERIGYVICDCVERQNQGTNWQIKFSNSGASVTIQTKQIIQSLMAS